MSVPTKVVRLDYEKFRKAVLAALPAEVGASYRLHSRAGIDHKAIYRLVKGEILRDFDNIMSIAEFCGLDITNFLLKRPWHEYKLDHELIRECCKNLCGNRARELAQILNVHHRTAHSLLRLGKPSEEVLDRIAIAVGCRPEDFHLNWRLRWYVHRDNEGAVKDGFPIYSRDLRDPD